MRRLLTALFLAAGLIGHAQAATAPSQWTSPLPGATGSPNYCSGCHAPHISNPDINLVDTSTFRNWVVSRNQNATMNNLASVSDADVDAIRKYILASAYAEISTGSLTYSSTLVGQENGSPQTITITNHSTSLLTVAVADIGTTSSAVYWYTNNTCTGGVSASGGTCSIQVHFKPQATGSATAQLKLTVGGIDQFVSLSGTGIAPTFSISTGTLPFTSMVGSPITSSATISNTGTANLALTGLSFSGAASGDYSLAGSNTCTNSTTLTPTSSCTLVVQFQPTATGTRSATLSITHSASGSPQSVTLNGTGTAVPAPVIQLSASSLSFGDVQLGSSSTLSLTLGNSGDAALVFSAFTKSGAASGDYTLGGTCSTSTPIAVSGAPCTLSVTFSPSALSTRAASVAISSNASPATISLSGMGIPVPVPVATLSTSSTDFGNQTIGGLYPNRTITLTNTGTASMSISAVAVTGAGFSLASSTCTGTLAAGAPCSMSVKFDPTTAGASYSGTLSVTDNASGSPHQVTLQGHGTAAAAPVLTWSPSVSTLDFGSVSAGTVSSVQSATLSNPGPGGALIHLINTVGVDAAYFSVSLSGCSIGEVLAEGATCRLDIRFAPGASGDKSATVQVASSGSTPPTLGVHGTGLASPSAQLGTSASAITFAPAHVGAQSDVGELRLMSTGAQALHVTALALTGPYQLDSKTCPPVPFDLAPGDSCSVEITFAPQSSGSLAGTLSISSDSVTAATTTVTLGGEGTPAPKQSGGGCSLIQGQSVLDPTLWILTLGAAAVLVHRRRRVRAASQQVR